MSELHKGVGVSEGCHKPHPLPVSCRWCNAVRRSPHTQTDTSESPSLGLLLCPLQREGNPRAAQQTHTNPRQKGPSNSAVASYEMVWSPFGHSPMMALFPPSSSRTRPAAQGKEGCGSREASQQTSPLASLTTEVVAGWG